MLLQSLSQSMYNSYAYLSWLNVLRKSSTSPAVDDKE